MMVGLSALAVRAQDARARADRGGRSSCAIGLTIWIWDPGDTQPIIEGALAMDTLTLGLSMLFYVAGLVTIVLSLRADAPREAGQGEYYSLLLGSIAGMVVLAGAENLITLFIGIELLSIPLYVLCATELLQARVARVRPQVPRDRLGRLGHAALRSRARLRRHRLHAVRGNRLGARR